MSLSFRCYPGRQLYRFTTVLLYISLLAFGSTGLAELLYVEYSVEVIPYGNHSLIHFDWKESGQKSGRLRHSQVYTSDLSLKKISDWVAAHL